MNFIQKMVWDWLARATSFRSYLIASISGSGTEIDGLYHTYNI